MREGWAGRGREPPEREASGERSANWQNRKSESQLKKGARWAGSGARVGTLMHLAGERHDGSFQPFIHWTGFRFRPEGKAKLVASFVASVGKPKSYTSPSRLANKARLSIGEG